MHWHTVSTTTQTCDQPNESFRNDVVQEFKGFDFMHLLHSRVHCFHFGTATLIRHGLLKNIVLFLLKRKLSFGVDFLKHSYFYACFAKNLLEFYI